MKYFHLLTGNREYQTRKFIIPSPLKEEEKIIFALTGNRVTQTKIIQSEIIGVIFIIR